MPAGWIRTSLAGLTRPRSVRAMRHAHAASACAVSLCQGRRLRVWVIFFFVFRQSGQPAALSRPFICRAPLRSRALAATPGEALPQAAVGRVARRSAEALGRRGRAPAGAAAPRKARGAGPGRPSRGRARRTQGRGAAGGGARSPPGSPSDASSGRGGAGPPLLAAGSAGSGVKVRPRAAAGEAPGARGPLVPCPAARAGRRTGRLLRTAPVRGLPAGSSSTFRRGAARSGRG